MAHLPRHVVQDGVQFHVLLRRHIAIQARVLENDAEAAAHFVGMNRRVQPVDRDFAAGRFQQRGEDLDRSGFPVPLGPRNAKISPSATSNEIPLTAVKSPYFFTRLVTRIV